MRARLLLITLGVSIVVACGGQGDDAESSGADLSGGGTDGAPTANRLLEDEDIMGGGAITAAQIQSFLESHSSVLATYTQDGQTASAIIADECHRSGVSPVYMLARIQIESSLVESKAPSRSIIDQATGCGCPDGQGCSAEYKGFTNQVRCAADLMKKYFTQLDSSGKTTSGYAVKKELKTLDPCTVTPQNRATTALYTYTPWVGAYASDCGTKKWAGSSGMASATRRYRDAFPNAGVDAGGFEGGAGTFGTPCAPEDLECLAESAPVDSTPACVPDATTTLCNAAWITDGVRCGFISDGCGGVVSCDSVDGFGCAAGLSCSSNTCSQDLCTPQSATDACNAAAQTRGVQCGSLSDGCGGSVTCDGVAGLGCSSTEICTGSHRCEPKSIPMVKIDAGAPAGATPPSPSSKPAPSPVATTAPDPPHKETAPPSNAAASSGTSGSSSASSNSSSSETNGGGSEGTGSGTSTGATKKPTTASSGCSSAPGGTGDATFLAGLAMALAAIRRRSRRVRVG